MSIKEEIQTRITLIEDIINARLIDTDGSSEDRQKQIYEAMNYSVLAGGKRLRPMLVLETARLFGGKEEDTYDFLTAIELIHTYSLVHDDLPAMDNDEYRRGRKTTHVVYGEDLAILAGDALLNYAYETGLNGVLQSGNPLQAAKALKILADKAGVFGMVGGQTVDIISENKVLDEETLNYINECKTSALIEAAMMMGAVLSGASEEELELVERIGSRIGLAFQIKDDILDVTGTAEVLGKPVLSDEKNHKSTYVTLLGIERAQQKVQELTKSALDDLLTLRECTEDSFIWKLLNSLVSREK
ncbi:MAG: polyprenyl synthetase family protein [Lachnospiraceae bacterium]|nr:polyprenyl synthetase family protein [Lachnospiraceae bacterium]